MSTMVVIYYAGCGQPAFARNCGNRLIKTPVQIKPATARNFPEGKKKRNKKERKITRLRLPVGKDNRFTELTANLRICAISH